MSTTIPLKGSVKFVNKEKQIFFTTLRQRVDQYFKDRQLSKSGDFRLWMKTAILLIAYVVPFVFICITNPGWLWTLACWTVMGLGMAGLGMSVMHDANHGAYSKHKSVNKIMSHILNLMGGSTVNWQLQHNVLHHTYTNITGLDDDIADKPGLRLSPHATQNASHKSQWWHAFLLYMLTTLYWATAKDFVQWIRYRKNKVNAMPEGAYRQLLIKLIIEKMVYFFVFLIMPAVFFEIPFSKLLAGFLVMHALAGLLLTTIFQLAHSLEGTSHPLPGNSGIIENDWAVHQMNTTVNFAPGNKLLSWYVGGLNYQVEHHLFPRISHIHYPAIASIVRTTAKEYGVPYLENKYLSAALKAHIVFLRKMGTLPDIHEAVA